MTLCMIVSYGLQTTQMNKKLPRVSSLNSTLTQYARDEDPKLRKMHLHLKVKPPQTWYYRISLIFRTLVILLQVDPTSSDEPKIVYEILYQIKNISIFT